MSDLTRLKNVVLKEVRAFEPLARGGADPEFVKESYETHWGKRIEGIRRKLEAGESIAHVLANLRGRPHQIASYNRVAGRIAVEFLAGHTGTSDAKFPLSRLGVTNGRYTAVPNFDPLTAIFRQARKATTIVELGAGPGWNLFDMSTFLGRSVADRRIYGLEYTQAGVDVITMLAQHEKLPITGVRFDYTAPDISMIPDEGPTLFFSHHSIEQVEDISEDLYKQILARKSPTVLIHCEPIGWQRFPDFVAARIWEDDTFYHALIAERTSSLDDDMAPAINASINSWRTRYNRNALGLIKNFAKDKRVAIRNEIYDFTHANNTNPVNPSTYVELVVKGQKVAPAVVTAEE